LVHEPIGNSRNKPPFKEAMVIRVNEFQIGDRVKLVETDREGVIIGRCYGDVRFEVRCDNGTYVRDLPPEALRLIEQSPRVSAVSQDQDVS
jgi:hypothetical protein